MALLYSMIGQLVRLLPPEFESNGKLDGHTFQDLDGSFESASTALDLVEFLLTHTPPTLTVIIDKLHLADNPATRPHLARLDALLRDLGSRQVVKALFATAGSLCGTYKVDEDGGEGDAGRMVQGKPCQPLRGWSSLGNLRVPEQGS